MLMVCLAAATVEDLPEDQRLTSKVQAAFSLALCILGAALLMAGAMVSRGHSRALLIGAFFPALAPLVMFWVILWHVEARHPGTFAEGATPMIDLLGRIRPLRRLFAIAWATIPCSSFACLLWHWSLKRGARRYLSSSPRARWILILVIALAWMLTAWALEATLRGLPEAGALACCKGVLQLALVVVFPGLLAVV